MGLGKRWMVLIFMVSAMEMDLGLVSGEVEGDDIRGLLAFKSCVGDPLGALNGWNAKASNAPCNWRGVSCVDGRVWELRLPGLGLQGPLTGGGGRMAGGDWAIERAEEDESEIESIQWNHS